MTLLYSYSFAYLYTLNDDSERPMDYETSLLPKICSLIIRHVIMDLSFIML